MPAMSKCAQTYALPSSPHPGPRASLDRDPRLSALPRTLPTAQRISLPIPPLGCGFSPATHHPLLTGLILLDSRVCTWRPGLLQDPRGTPGTRMGFRVSGAPGRAHPSPP